MLSKIYSRLIYIMAVLMMLPAITACEDDFPTNGIIVGPGESLVTGTVQFTPLMASLDGSGRAEPGDIISSIVRLSLVVYTPDGDNEPKLLDVYNLTSSQFTELEEPNTGVPSDWKPGDTKAEQSTKRYKVTIPEALHYGKYYIYAVANLGRDLTKEEVATPSKLQKIRVAWQSTVAADNQMFGYFVAGSNGASGPTDGVYSAPLITVNQPETALHAWLRRLASKVTICYSGSQLDDNVYVYVHKATIKQIPKECLLGESSAVCGKTEADTVNYIEGQSIYYNAQRKAVNEDKYPALSQYAQWMEINRSTPLAGAISTDNGVTTSHGESDLALFFYENMQGEFKDLPNKDEYDKRQDPASVGKGYLSIKPGDPDYKDKVPCGTYIEVEGFYINNNPDEMSSGKIIYRFMLGQDINYNYNCERNQHYKLTMNFIGKANQVDWHITYIEENPGIYAPTEFYMPYLYNHKVDMPIRLTGNPVRVTMQVVENNWAPYDSTQVDSVPLYTDNFKWAKDIYENTTQYPPAGNFSPAYQPSYGFNSGFYYGLRDGREFNVYTRSNLPNNLQGLTPPLPDEIMDESVYNDVAIFPEGRKVTPIWAGFLALTAPSGHENGTLAQLPTSIMNFRGNDDYNDFYNDQNTVNGIKDYYLGKGGRVSPNNYNTIAQHIVVLDDISDGSHSYVGTGGGLNTYSIKSNPATGGNDESKTLYVPLFTRSKAIGYISGFTGNNPYETFCRKATLRITGEFELTSGERRTIVKEVRILQERRIVNPKAIWRRYDNPGTFQVELKLQKSPGSATFEPLTSKGPWEAYFCPAGSSADVAGTSPYFEVSGGEKKDGNKVKGSTGSFIKFNISFKQQLPNASDTQCGRVVVKYHGGYCEHVIFLRQGYDSPIALVDNPYTVDGVSHAPAKWSSYNVFKFTAGNLHASSGAEGELAISPCEAGSLFKQGNYLQGILEENYIQYPLLTPLNGGTLKLTDGTYTQWGVIPSYVWGGWGSSPVAGNWVWSNVKVNISNEDREYRFPVYEDYQALLDQDCDFGYGVLYGDGTSTTLTSANDAFTYLNTANEQNNVSDKGMRGVIVYNPRNMNQVFFPIGAGGVGRRTNKVDDPESKGYLRYAAIAQLLSWNENSSEGSMHWKGYNQYRPICYDIISSPGAMYWLKKPYGDKVAWDMNYFDMSFNAQDYALLNGGLNSSYGSDAVRIRLVRDE